MSNAMPDFGTLNWSILIVYLIGNLFLGFVISKKVQSADDFYLGDRSTPWWAIGVSVIATYVSALTFLGGPAWSYTDGLGVVAIHLNYPLVIFIVVSVFLPFFFNAGVTSIYEYQERRFGAASRSVMSTIFLISQSLTSAAVLYATALVLQFITGIDVVTAIVVVTIVALIYTALGGITAVIWTDVIQAGILFLGAIIIFVALLGDLQAPLGETLSALKAEGKTNPLNFNLDFSEVATVWSGVIAMTLFHVTVYGANQMMVQRSLAAKNMGDAKKSILMMGFAAFFIYFMFMLLGILFYNYYGGKPFENGNTIILDYAAEVGIPGLMGIIAAAVMAASMSSLDSAFNSMATVSTIDFYQRYFKPDESGEHYLNVSRVFTLIWAAVIIIPAILYAQSSGSILETLSKVGSYFVGAKLSMFGLGFLSQRTNQQGLLVGVVAGFIAVWYVATQTDIAWPWFCAIGAGINILVAWPVSFLVGRNTPDQLAYTIQGQRQKFASGDQPTEQDGWSVVPGKVDRVSWWLLGFFALTMVFLFTFEILIP